MSTPESIVIVGGGLAGGRAAGTLREEGFEGRVVLIGREPEEPYERPPLSKGYLQGKDERESARVHEHGFYAEHGIELRLGASVERLDLSGRAVVLSSGERVGFDRLLLATGADPRRLTGVPGADLAGIHVLRTLADSDHLRAALERGGRLLVVGAGWIGAEVAASARGYGVEVTLVDPLAAPLERVLGHELGEVFAALHSDHGVDMRMETGVAAFEGDARVERVRLSDGRTVAADDVVVGVGVVPATGLAEGLLDVADGISVDARLQTSAPGVFAAGDVASAFHPRLGRHLRVEHWANALHQGPAAARSMLGADAPYDRIPYFFSDQYDLGMEYSGDPAGADALVIRGDLPGREFIAFWLRDGRVLAGANVNVWDVVEPIQALIRSGAAVDANRLADPAVPLDEVG
jgi:3-phenylpropionate/trans-cinnamate dioxygenase ferredoxin reductase component